ncbi:unnamed protein product [Larinioides sclopetarius]|uniref:Uncharacterized protein n=1 Tax=Larinioides sclopetarius TaxID=280406 RepID=A0AAV2BT47_9ARAC
MKPIAVIPILIVFVVDFGQGAFIDPNFLLKGNEGLNNVNKDLNLNLKPGLDLGNLKSNSWPNKFDLQGGSFQNGVNALQGKIGGTIWQNKNKDLSFDLDLKPAVAWSSRNGMAAPSFNALGTFKWDFGK